VLTNIFGVHRARQKPSRCKYFNPAGASEFPRRPRLRSCRKALRRASGVWSLGGAGLNPE